MPKRFFALILAFLLCASALPCAARAEVLSGWNSKVDYENTDPNRYFVEIDLTNQVITVYEGYMGGTIVLQSLCTTGSAEFPTGTGTYKMGALKERFGYFVAFGQYAQYWSQVVRGVYIHSVLYNSSKLTSMSRSAYRDLGKNVSHGCVRALPEVARWIFYNCPPGTTCKIVKKAADPNLVAALKKTIPSFDKYVQPTDDKPYPQEVPALIRFDGTPLRTGFSASKDKTIATLKAGDKVLLLQIALDWCKVRTAKGEIGYVKSQYILAYPDAESTAVTSYAAKGRTYVYMSASTGAKTLARVPAGAPLSIAYRVNDSWWYGTYEGVSGYIRAKYVSVATSYVYPSFETPAPTDAGSPGNSGTGLESGTAGGATPGSTPGGGSGLTLDGGRG